MKRIFSLLLATFLFAGCTRQNVATKPSPIGVWGSRGTKAGEFYEPRAIAVDDRFAFIVDSSGRVQTWTKDGKFVRAWQAPSIERGRPEGVAILPNGDLVVTDTHYSRVLIYARDGKLKRTFGKYGKQKGGFLLVTGVTVDPDGHIFTCDYGGTFDRVSKWTSEGKLLASWPGHGEGPRQFRRPCGLAISREGDLLVADIGNHRVQRLDRFTGECKNPNVLGTRGSEAGQLTYPYGVAVDKSGQIYTVEYGNHRVQKWSQDGKYLAMWGGAGRQIGKIANPWGLAVDNQNWVYVADTQNHRVQKFRFN